MKYLGGLALLVVVSCAGCGGGETGASNPIFGTWTVRSIQVSNQAAQSCPASITAGGTTVSCTAADTQTFRTDGTFTDSRTGQSGRFSLIGSSLTLIPNSGGLLGSTVDINGNTMTQTVASTAGPIQYTLQKQSSTP